MSWRVGSGIFSVDLTIGSSFRLPDECNTLHSSGQKYLIFFGHAVYLTIDKFARKLVALLPHTYLEKAKTFWITLISVVTCRKHIRKQMSLLEQNLISKVETVAIPPWALGNSMFEHFLSKCEVSWTFKTHIRSSRWPSHNLKHFM